jgi:hypothetical protein
MSNENFDHSSRDNVKLLARVPLSENIAAFFDALGDKESRQRRQSLCCASSEKRHTFKP